LDLAIISIRLPRFPTAAQAACERASQAQAAQQSREIRADPAIGFTLLRQFLERLATTPNPTTRIGMWGFLNNVARPELVQSLATALRDSTDDAFRKEAVTLLAVKFAADPAARDALVAVAASGPDTLMRRVAERAVSREEPWHDYAVARLRDTTLPSDQRLEAWYWMADAMPLDQDKMRAALADMLTELQQRDGVRVLAELLADTQKDVSETGYGIAGQQGQRTMTLFGAVNHPAAPELLISYYEAEPNYLTLGVLATRRDDPRIASMLESIAADQTDQRMSRRAANYLSQPLER
jgi:hypothetical protein